MLITNLLFKVTQFYIEYFLVVLVLVVVAGLDQFLAEGLFGYFLRESEATLRAYRELDTAEYSMKAWPIPAHSVWPSFGCGA